VRKHETQSCSESCVFSFSNPILLLLLLLLLFLVLLLLLLLLLLLIINKAFSQINAKNTMLS